MSIVIAATISLILFARAFFSLPAQPYKHSATKLARDGQRPGRRQGRRLHHYRAPFVPSLAARIIWGRRRYCWAPTTAGFCWRKTVTVPVAKHAYDLIEFPRQSDSPAAGIGHKEKPCSAQPKLPSSSGKKPSCKRKIGINASALIQMATRGDLVMVLEDSERQDVSENFKDKQRRIVRQSSWCQRRSLCGFRD